MRCYCALARRATRRLTRLFDAELDEAGMNAPQFELLGTLSATPGVSQVELAELMDVDPSTLSRNLRLVVERGWVSAMCCARDRRSVEYAVSEAGMVALSAGLAGWQRAMSEVEAKLGEDGQAALELLERLGEAAG